MKSNIKTKALLVGLLSLGLVTQSRPMEQALNTASDLMPALLGLAAIYGFHSWTSEDENKQSTSVESDPTSSTSSRRKNRKSKVKSHSKQTRKLSKDEKETLSLLGLSNLISVIESGAKWQNVRNTILQKLGEQRIDKSIIQKFIKKQITLSELGKELEKLNEKANASASTTSNQHSTETEAVPTSSTITQPQVITAPKKEEEGKGKEKTTKKKETKVVSKPTRSTRTTVTAPSTNQTVGNAFLAARKRRQQQQSTSVVKPESVPSTSVATSTAATTATQPQVITAPKKEEEGKGKEKITKKKETKIASTPAPSTTTTVTAPSINQAVGNAFLAARQRRQHQSTSVVKKPSEHEQDEFQHMIELLDLKELVQYGSANEVGKAIEKALKNLGINIKVEPANFRLINQALMKRIEKNNDSTSVKSTLVKDDETGKGKELANTALPTTSTTTTTVRKTHERPEINAYLISMGEDFTQRYWSEKLTEKEKMNLAIYLSNYSKDSSVGTQPISSSQASTSMTKEEKQAAIIKELEQSERELQEINDKELAQKLRKEEENRVRSAKSTTPVAQPATANDAEVALQLQAREQQRLLDEQIARAAQAQADRETARQLAQSTPVASTSTPALEVQQDPSLALARQLQAEEQQRLLDEQIARAAQEQADRETARQLAQPTPVASTSTTPVAQPAPATQATATPAVQPDTSGDRALAFAVAPH